MLYLPAQKKIPPPNKARVSHYTNWVPPYIEPRSLPTKGGGTVTRWVSHPVILCPREETIYQKTLLQWPGLFSLIDPQRAEIGD